MRIGKIVLAALCALFIAGCAATDVTRATTGITAPLLSSQESVAAEQAAALRDLTAALLRKSTLRGAAFGAALGCGVATVAGDSGCLPAAVLGGTVGGIAGHAAGQRQIARQIEIIAPDRVLPTLSSARAQLRQIETSVPALLAAQDAELADLRAQVTQGRLPQASYDARLAAIRQIRTDLAASLLTAADQTRATHDAMAAARDQGQDGLDWYLSATDEMERRVISTRSAITLL